MHQAYSFVVLRHLLPLLAVTLFVGSFCGQAQAATCSGLKKAAAEAGLSVQGTKWVTVPKGHEWQKALPLYNDLKDYDVDLLPLHCRQLARLIKGKVTEIVSQHAVLLRVRLTGDAYRVADRLTVMIDNQTVETSVDESDKGLPYTAGRHEVSIEVPTLKRDEKVVIKPSLNGSLVPVGGQGDRFALDLPPTAEGGTHDLALNVTLVRRCVFTLRVNNETEQNPSKRAVLVLHGASSMPLTSGAVRVAGGRHALEVELEEDTRVDVAIDGRQLIPTDGGPVEGKSLRYIVPLECPKGQDQGRASLVVSLPQTEMHDNGSGGGEGGGMPTLFWVGTGVATTGILMSGISYFGFQSPADDRGTKLFSENGCGTAAATCDAEVQSRVNAAWDESDSAGVWTVTGLIVGGVGAAVAITSLFFDDPADSDQESAYVQVHPSWQPGQYGLTAVGRF